MNQVFLYFVLLLLTLPACTRSAQREPEAEPSVPVIAEPVRLGTIRGTVSATGVVTTLAGAAFNVTARHPARVAEITKKPGDAVKSGEMLVRFEFPSLGPQIAVNAAAAKAAERRLQLARLTQSRIRSLVSQGAASRREMEDADREAAEAEGDLSAASSALHAVQSSAQNADVSAPFDGTVVERLHDPGDLVRAGDEDPILRLIDPTQVQVTATVAIADLTRFSVGATARAVADLRRPQATASDLPGDGRATTVVMRIVSRPEPESGATTVPVILAFDRPTDLAPGTQVALEIDAEQRSDVPLVPVIAVLGAGDDRYVMIAAGNIATQRPVAIGLTEGERVEIRSGVKAGELIITQGHSSLRDGTPISVSPP